MVLRIPLSYPQSPSYALGEAGATVGSTRRLELRDGQEYAIPVSVAAIPVVDLMEE